MVIEDNDYEDYGDDEDLQTIYEEFLEDLRYLNSMLGYPIDKESPHIIESRETLIRNIKVLRERLDLPRSFDTSVGYDPFKIYRMDFLFRD